MSQPADKEQLLMSYLTDLEALEGHLAKLSEKEVNLYWTALHNLSGSLYLVQIQLEERLTSVLEELEDGSDLDT